MPHGSIGVGGVEITALCDVAAEYPRAFSVSFPDVPADRAGELRDLYPDAWNGDDRWLFHDHCYLIRSEGRIILVDTGIGPSGTEGSRWIHASGGLPQELKAAGVKLADVDAVVITHLHLDHIGWNLSRPGNAASAERQPTFPRARYVVHRADWEYFPTHGDEVDRPAFEENVRPLQDAGLLELIDAGRALTSEVTVKPAPGHTPGHLVVEIESGVERAVAAGDVANHPAQVTEPRWRTASDVDPKRAAETRRTLFERMEARGETLATAHFPQPFGTLVRRNDGRRWTPTAAVDLDR